MLALCLILSKTYYAQNYAGIIGLGLSGECKKVRYSKEQIVINSLMKFSISVQGFSVFIVHSN